MKSSLSPQEVHNESRTTCGGFEWIPSGVNVCRKLVLIAFGLDSVLIMSRELSDVPEASWPDVCGEVIISASNNCLDDVCERPSPLVVDLSENAENKGFFHVENEQHSSEVRIRKLTEKGQSYQNDIKLNSFKNKMSSFKGTLKKTLLFRGHYNELSKWKQELSKAQVLGNDFVDAYNDILETVPDNDRVSEGQEHLGASLW